MKRYISGLITGFIISFGMVAFATEFDIIENPFPVLINGVVETVEGFNINGYTYLKLGDFKKAGLDIKFNDTDKIIEVASPASGKGVIIRHDSTPDGISKIDEWEGKYYIGFTHIQNKCKERGYDFIFDTRTEKWVIKKAGTIILSDMPFINIYGRDSFEYDYYVNTILPITQ